MDTHVSLMLLLGMVSTGFQVTKGTDAGCPADLPVTESVVRLHDTCYQFVYEEKRWPSARDFCWENGGRLVKVDGPEISQFLVDTLNAMDQWSNNGVWIGLHDRVAEQRFKWIAPDEDATDEPFEWSRWASGHPESWGHGGEDCVRMVRDDDWAWKESPCSRMFYQYRFICQYDALDPMTGQTPPKTPDPMWIHVSMSTAPGVRRTTIPRRRTTPPNLENDVFSTRPPPTSTRHHDFNEVHVRVASRPDSRRAPPADEPKNLPQDHPNGGTGNGISPELLVIIGVTGSVIGTIALCVAIILVALKRRKKSVRVRGPEERRRDVPSDKVVYSVEGKTVTYRVDEGQPIRPGNLYVGHRPEATAPRVPGTPHPRGGQVLTYPSAGHEEDGYMVPRNHDEYTPMGGSERGSEDPLPDLPEFTTSPEKYGENTYESLDDVQEQKRQQQR